MVSISKCENAIDIIEGMRCIVKGIPSTYDITDFLQKHNCNYLLSKNKQTPNFPECDWVINSMSAVEGFKALTPFFEKTDIKYVITKGAYLSKRIYNNPNIRFSSDIDILISRKDCEKIVLELNNLDFVQGYINGDEIHSFSRESKLFYASMTHQLPPFVKRISNLIPKYINVDVNTNILWGESMLQINMEEFLDYSQCSQLFGLGFNTLIPEAEFIAMCLHHYKDFNSIYLLFTRGMRLDHFCDIFYYIKNVKMDRCLLFSLVERYNIGEYIYYCLHYTNIIFDDVDLKCYLDMFEVYKNKSLIDSFGLCDDERKEWETPFFDRLFLKDFQNWFSKKLTEKDFKKINYNMLYM